MGMRIKSLHVNYCALCEFCNFRTPNERVKLIDYITYISLISRSLTFRLRSETESIFVFVVLVSRKSSEPPGRRLASPVRGPFEGLVVQNVHETAINNNNSTTYKTIHEIQDERGQSVGGCTEIGGIRF